MTKLLLSLATVTIFGGTSLNVATPINNNVTVKNKLINEYQIILGINENAESPQSKFAKVTSKGVQPLFAESYFWQVANFKYFNDSIYQIGNNILTKEISIQKLSLDGQLQKTIFTLPNLEVYNSLEIVGNNLYLITINLNEGFKLYEIANDEIQFVTDINVTENPILQQVKLINYKDQVFVNIDTGIGSWNGTPALYKLNQETSKFEKIVEITDGNAIGTSERDQSYVVFNDKLYIGYRTGLYEYNLNEKPTVKKIFKGYISNLVNAGDKIQFTDTVSAIIGTALISYDGELFENYYIFEDKLIDSLIHLNNYSYVHFNGGDQNIWEIDNNASVYFSIGKLDFDTVIAYQNI